MLRIVNRRKRVIAEKLDSVGRAVHSLFPLPARRSLAERREIKHILVIRFAYIGDVVLTIPALRPLKKAFPEARICFLTSTRAREALEKNPYISDLITYDPPWFYPGNKAAAVAGYVKLIREIRFRRFDTVIDFRGDFRNILLVVFPSGAPRKVGCGMTGGGYLLTTDAPWCERKHKVDFHLDIIKGIGANPTERDAMDLYPTTQEREKVRKICDSRGIGPDDLVIGLHPGGRVPLKRWSPESFAEVAQHLVKRYGAKIVVTGSLAERTLGDRVRGLLRTEALNLCGVLNLRELQAFLKRLSLIVTGDTAVLHIASGADVPTVALFGPSELWDTAPLSRMNRVVMRDIACRASCDTYRCNNINYHECLSSIEPAEVIRACADLLRKPVQ